mgnify:CR=1 FL=1
MRIALGLLACLARAACLDGFPLHEAAYEGSAETLHPGAWRRPSALYKSFFFVATYA